MGIAPIDLQTMYVNMNNVAQTVANQQQGVQLAQQLQESKIIQQNMEKSSVVRRAADNESKSSSIKDEGHSGSGTYNGEEKRNSEPESGTEKKRPSEIRESYLGLHIDIER